MKSETAEYFTWLFNSFLELVNHNVPNVLLMDNDAAIGSAYASAFKDLGTKHRLCI